MRYYLSLIAIIFVSLELSGTCKIEFVAPITPEESIKFQEIIERSLKGSGHEDVDPNGDTLLIMAAKAGNADLVEQLLSAGADADEIEGNYGTTPLFWAVKGGHVEVVKQLLKCGADPNKAEKMAGYTPLIEAVTAYNCNNFGNYEIAKLLLEAGCDPNKSDKSGATPLHYATILSTIEMMKLLFIFGADLHRINNPGDTPLMDAVKGGRIKKLLLLLEEGADPSIPDRRGWIPLQWAIFLKHQHANTLFCKAYAEVEKLLSKCLLNHSH